VLLVMDLLTFIHEALDDAIPDFEKNAKAFLVITGIVERTTYKYGEEGRTFPYIEAGYMGANITLLLEEAGFNSVAVGVQWCIDELAQLLDISQSKEQIISGLAIF